MKCIGTDVVMSCGVAGCRISGFLVAYQHDEHALYIRPQTAAGGCPEKLCVELLHGVGLYSQAKFPPLKAVMVSQR